MLTAPKTRNRLAGLMLLVSLPFFPAGAGGAPIARIRRGAIRGYVHISGKIEPVGTISVEAPMDGRVESLRAAPYQWIALNQPLAILVSSELALILDSAQTTSQDVVAKRWKEIYRPQTLPSPADGFVLQVDIEPKKNMRRGESLFELARYLVVVSTVSPEDQDWLKQDQPATLRTPEDSGRSVNGYVLKVARGSARKKSPARVEVALAPQGYGLAPGQPVLGKILVADRSDTLLAPKRAFVRRGEKTYLMLEVRTGAVGEKEIEILSGIRPGAGLLMPDEACK